MTLGFNSRIVALGFILITLISVSANAATTNDLTYTIAEGEVTITDCDLSASGNLIIPVSIEQDRTSATHARSRS